MLSLASSNRFDDQRSPAPKALSLPKPRQPHSTPVSEDRGAPLDENRDRLSASFDREDSGFALDDIPPPLAMSLPDLLSDDKSDTQSRFNSIDRLYSTPERSQTHSKPQSLTYVCHTQSLGGGSLDQPASEPFRRRAIQRAGNVVGEELNSSLAGGSPTTGGHRASPLATTSHVYSPSEWRRSIDGGEGDGESEKPSLNPLEGERGKRGEGEVLALDRDSPDGKHPAEAQVGDMDLPQRTIPDGAATRQKVRASPSDPRQPPRRGERGEEVREGWAEEIERCGSSPTSRTSAKRTSSPMTTPLSNGGLRPRRVLSEGDRCQSLEEILDTEEARSSHILFDAGLGHLSPHSPIVKGVWPPVRGCLPVRGQSFSGGSPKLANSRRRQAISEHHEM